MDPEIHPTVDFALLADAVQATGGKLHILGGGWDTLWVGRFPARHHSLGMGLRLRIPWTYANQDMELAIDLQDEDGASLFDKGVLRHGFRVARPRGLPDGVDVGLVRAFTFNNLPFGSAGGYAFVISIDGEERSRLRFRVQQRPVRKPVVD